LQRSLDVYLKQYFCCGIIFSAPLPSGEVLPYLNTPHATNMQMKVDRCFKDQIQKSTNRLFEIIELNVDEPILFKTSKRRKQLLERKNVSGKYSVKSEKRKIMLVIPR
jgi:hypothetical protein